MVHGCTKYVRKGNDVQIHTGKPAVPTATPNRQPFAWPKLLTENGRGIAFGGDYNPDQWSEETWDDDVCLMKKAGVNTVALAIFSWDRIQPQENRWDFGWLDRIIDKLGKAGIATDLASATATAPLWLYEKHPEVLPCDKFGHPVNAGSRQSWSPTSPVFKEYALTLCRKLAERYGANPYVTAWHMGNEYGWNNRNDYSDNALNAFRLWCERKYGTIGALNQAWGTTFWGQEMNSFDEVLIPRFMGADSMVNPGQKLDFERFGNDMLLDFYKAERDAIAEICPDKPFTTNFMVSTDQCCMDYADWANEVNFVSNDHYFHEGGEMHLDELACSDALMDSFALGKPGMSWNTPLPPCSGSRSTCASARGRRCAIPLHTLPWVPTRSTSSSGARPHLAPNPSTPPWFRTREKTRSYSVKCASWAKRCKHWPMRVCRVVSWNAPTRRSCSAPNRNGLPVPKPCRA